MIGPLEDAKKAFIANTDPQKIRDAIQRSVDSRKIARPTPEQFDEAEKRAAAREKEGKP